MQERAAPGIANARLAADLPRHRPASVLPESVGNRDVRETTTTVAQSGRMAKMVSRRLRNDASERIKLSDLSDHTFSRDRATEDWFDPNLLDLMLTAVVPDGDRAAICRCLLKEFGSFADVICAPPQRLEELLQGFEHAVAFLKGLEIVALRLAQREIRRRPVLADPATLIRYVRVALGRAPVRQIRLLFVNDAMELIADERHRCGTINHAPLYPREVIKRALHHDATGIILIQNDPSGRCWTSAVGRDATNKLADSLKAIGITLHDHLIVSRYEHVSFREFGML
jgi:DNA repair protein RadC